MIRTALLTSCLGLWLAAQTPAPAPATSSMTVYGWVQGANGLPEKKLDPADYELLVDGVAQPLLSVTPRQQPASVIVLFDTSRSTAWPERPLDDQIAEFASALDPANHLMIATVGARSSFPPFATASRDVRAEVRRALDVGHDDGYGNSPIWDAVNNAVTLLARQSPPRAVLLLTDGRGTGNEIGMADVADHAMANGVTVTVVLRNSAQWIRQQGGTAALVQPGVPIQSFTTFTGGMYFTYPEQQPDAARKMFSFVAAAIDSMHAFSFALAPDGSPHRIQIRTATPQLTPHLPLAFVAR